MSSPLETRMNIGQICRDCELEISRILLTVDLRAMDMLEFDVIIVIIGGLLPTHWMMFVLGFRGINKVLYPKPCTIIDGTGS